MVLNIVTAVSQWEREAIGDRTRDAMSQKRTNGERMGNIQFGYRLCADEIRNLRQSGKTLRGIAPR